MIYSYDKSLRSRQADIRKYINPSSPFLVWSGNFGILIIAPNKQAHTSRIHKIYDRIACVTRGMSSAGDRLWKPAVIMADKEAFRLSPGDVYAHDISVEISEFLVNSWNNIQARPIQSEIGFIQIDAEMGSDYLAYIDKEGNLTEHQYLMMYGFETKKDTDIARNKGAADNSVAKDASLSALTGIYNADMSSEEVINLLRNYVNSEDKNIRLIGQLLFDEQFKKTEMVILSRPDVKQKKFSKVYKRL